MVGSYNLTGAACLWHTEHSVLVGPESESSIQGLWNKLRQMWDDIKTAEIIISKAVPKQRCSTRCRQSAQSVQKAKEVGELWSTSCLPLFGIGKNQLDHHVSKCQDSYSLDHSILLAQKKISVRWQCSSVPHKFVCFVKLYFPLLGQCRGNKNDSTILSIPLCF